MHHHGYPTLVECLNNPRMAWVLAILSGMVVIGYLAIAVIWWRVRWTLASGRDSRPVLRALDLLMGIFVFCGVAGYGTTSLALLTGWAYPIKAVATGVLVCLTWAFVAMGEKPLREALSNKPFKPDQPVANWSDNQAHLVRDAEGGNLMRRVLVVLMAAQSLFGYGLPMNAGDRSPVLDALRQTYGQETSSFMACSLAVILFASVGVRGMQTAAGLSYSALAGMAALSMFTGRLPYVGVFLGVCAMVGVALAATAREG